MAVTMTSGTGQTYQVSWHWVETGLGDRHMGFDLTRHPNVRCTMPGLDDPIDVPFRVIEDDPEPLALEGGE